MSLSSLISLTCSGRSSAGWEEVDSFGGISSCRNSEGGSEECMVIGASIIFPDSYRKASGVALLAVLALSLAFLNVSLQSNYFRMVLTSTNSCSSLDFLRTSLSNTKLTNCSVARFLSSTTAGSVLPINLGVGKVGNVPLRYNCRMKYVQLLDSVNSPVCVT